MSAITPAFVPFQETLYLFDHVVSGIAYYRNPANGLDVTLWRSDAPDHEVSHEELISTVSVPHERPIEHHPAPVPEPNMALVFALLCGAVYLITRIGKAAWCDPMNNADYINSGFPDESADPSICDNSQPFPQSPDLPADSTSIPAESAVDLPTQGACASSAPSTGPDIHSRLRAAATVIEIIDKRRVAVHDQRIGSNIERELIASLTLPLDVSMEQFMRSWKVGL